MNQEEMLTKEQFAEYLSRFSGNDSYGNANAVGSYQLYAAEDDASSRDRKTIYKINKASYYLRHDKTHPQFIALDIRFNAYDDTELKLLWSRLKKFEESGIKDPDKTWILHFMLLETDSLSEETDQDDILLIAHLVNPIMSFLTRETPTTLAEDKIVNGERYGGNVVRMLFTTDYVSLEESGEYNTSTIKGEILREEAARDYVDNYEPPEDDGSFS